MSANVIKKSIDSFYKGLATEAFYYKWNVSNFTEITFHDIELKVSDICAITITIKLWGVIPSTENGYDLFDEFVENYLSSHKEYDALLMNTEILKEGGMTIANLRFNFFNE